MGTQSGTTKDRHIEQGYEEILDTTTTNPESNIADSCEEIPHEENFDEVEWFDEESDETRRDRDDYERSELVEYRFVDLENHLSEITVLQNDDRLQLAAETAEELTALRSQFKPSLEQVTQIDKLAVENPNCANFYKAVSNQLFFHVNTKQAIPCTISPILLVGGAGVGKTYATKRLADTLKLHSAKINLSNATEALVLSGCPRGYGTSVPGEVATKLSKSAVINPLIILDEIDKASFARTERPNLTGPLLTLLEGDTAEEFEDSCLRMNIDASHVSWIATANSLEGIPEPILSRFQIFDISKLSTDAMHGVIELIAKQTIENFGLPIDISIDRDVKVINASTRDLKKALLISVHQKYRDDSHAKKMHITASDLRPYLREERESSIGFHRF